MSFFLVIPLIAFFAAWVYHLKSVAPPKKIKPRARDMTEEEMYNELDPDFLLKNGELKSNGFPTWYKNEAHVSFGFVKFTKEATVRSCKRCKEKFNIGSKGNPPICRHHPKGKKRESDGTAMKSYKCCNKVNPCKQAIGHVPHEIPTSELKTFLRSPRENSGRDSRSNKIYALDCEMIYTENGLSIARLTVVDVNGKVVMNDIIEPRSAILDFNTEFSGISHQTYTSAERVYSLEQSRNRLFKLINEKSILIGHGLQNDLIALRLVHRRVVDTSVLYLDPRNSKENSRAKFRFSLSLKELAGTHLNKGIQTNSELGHCSEEDAVTALELVRKEIDSRNPDL